MRNILLHVRSDRAPIMSTTCEGSGAAGTEATYALHHHNRPQSFGRTGHVEHCDPHQTLHTKRHLQTGENKTLKPDIQQIKTTKHMVGEHTSKYTRHFCALQIFICPPQMPSSSENYINGRTWQRHLWVQQMPIIPWRFLTAGPSGLVGLNCYQVFIMGVLLKRGGLVQTWQGVDLSTRNHLGHYLDRISTPSGGANWLR